MSIWYYMVVIEGVFYGRSSTCGRINLHSPVGVISACISGDISALSYHIIITNSVIRITYSIQCKASNIITGNRKSTTWYFCTGTIWYCSRIVTTTSRCESTVAEQLPPPVDVRVQDAAILTAAVAVEAEAPFATLELKKAPVMTVIVSSPNGANSRCLFLFI